MADKIEKDQEYIYDNRVFTFFANIEAENESQDEWVVVQDEDYVIATVRKKDLVKKEDTYQYKRAQERADEIRLITAKAEEKLDELSDKLVDKALKQLSTRMKLNTVFSKDLGNASGWALTVSNELEKMIKEQAKETIEDKKSFSF